MAKSCSQPVNLPGAWPLMNLPHTLSMVCLPGITSCIKCSAVCLQVVKNNMYKVFSKT